MALAAIAFAPGILRFGWPEGEAPVPPGLVHVAQAVLLAAYAVMLLVERVTVRRAGRSREGRHHGFEWVTLGLAAVLALWWPALAIAAGLLVVFHMVRLYVVVVERTSIPPGAVFVGSFIVLIAAGTLALKLPAATPPDQPISTLDAAFTITSAISQTGLVVRPTGEGFTRFGQTVIMVWIQLGALGVLVFGAVFALVLGSGFGLKATQTLAEGTEQGWVGQFSLARLVAFIIIVTHALEAAGVAALYFGWPAEWKGAPDMESAGDRLYHCVFFSVSAFCNAGFVTTTDSLESLRVHWTSHVVIAGLIVLGSIGFPVLNDFRRTVMARFRRQVVIDGALVRLTLNSKLILTTTLCVYLLGVVSITIGELSQANVPLGVAALDAHFMTINRTSGFDTIPPVEMGLFSQLTLILLMFIGGSPGSVAGGIKIMVFAVLVLTVWATIRGRSETTVFGRAIPDELVRKSATLIVLCLATVMVVAGVVAAADGGEGGPSLEKIIFECVSAFGTTGLSMGITSDLGPVSRAALMVAMFLGRVGTFATIAALVTIARRRRPTYAYPTEGVIIY